MMKSADEIKKGLKIGACDCGNVRCCEDECPYERECSPCNDNKNADLPQALLRDALAYIKQLEAERDAAVDALTKIVQRHDESFCEYYNNWDRYTCPPSCRTHCERFNWRGVQKEDGNAKSP